MQYRSAVGQAGQSPLQLQNKQRSFLTFGFGAGGSGRRESHINVNVTPTGHEVSSTDTPEIRKYKKRFNSEILCAALWGESGRAQGWGRSEGPVYVLFVVIIYHLLRCVLILDVWINVAPKFIGLVHAIRIQFMTNKSRNFLAI